VYAESAVLPRESKFGQIIPDWAILGEFTMSFALVKFSGLIELTCLLPLLVVTFYLQLRKLPLQNVLAATAIILLVALFNIVLLDGVHREWGSIVPWTEALLEALFVWVPAELNSRLIARWLAFRVAARAQRGLVVIIIASNLAAGMIFMLKDFSFENQGHLANTGHPFSWFAFGAGVAFYMEHTLLQILLTPWLISKRPRSQQLI